jgi:hypothetical protein
MGILNNRGYGLVDPKSRDRRSSSVASVVALFCRRVVVLS